MCIGNVDRLTTAVLEKRIERQQQTLRLVKPSVSVTAEFNPLESDTRIAKVVAIDAMTMTGQMPSLNDSGSGSGRSDISKNSWTQTRTTYNLMDVKPIAKEAERWGVSDTAAASIATATLIAAGLVTPEDENLVIDRHKIRRARLTLRASCVEKYKGETVHALFFDGRKDKTLKYESGRFAHVVEEHISLLREPGSIYLSHITTLNTRAATIVTGILERLQDKNIDVNRIKAIGSDGEATNTGIHAGVIRSMEIELQTNVQWLICLLHANELPLRCLGKSLLGATTDPISFAGPIGRQLKTCEKLPIVAFERIRISEELLNFDTSVLNTDNKYLIDICRIISTGIVPPNFEKRPPGTLTFQCIHIFINFNLFLTIPYISRCNGTFAMDDNSKPLLQSVHFNRRAR